ncbi:MAG: hypothetical protein Q8O19_02245 [Rectinemataceae bacterium]|nr:hypothetical protein [Rectinemataceae bacterium]
MEQENKDAIDILLSKEDRLTEWEVNFLESISELDGLTEKQLASLDAIWKRVMDGYGRI